MRSRNEQGRLLRAAACALALSCFWQAAIAEPVGDGRRSRLGDEIDDDEPTGVMPLPTGVRVMRDVAYGSDPRQRMDVYLPPQTVGAPAIVMVHGGAWRLGDKAASAVVDNKMARWTARGFIFVSVNYRLLPDSAPHEQAQDVAAALAAAQSKAVSWGGDPDKFILIGHSAGAHLAALLAASPATAMKFGARPWLGTVVLDSAALDVERIMEAPHVRVYDRAFGRDAAYWKAVSPFRALDETAKPLLVVCAIPRAGSCAQAFDFVDRAKALKVRAEVLEQHLPHKEINRHLGAAGSYTEAVEAFMATLDETLQRRLAKPAPANAD